MIKAIVDTQNTKKGVSLVIMGTKQDLFNEMRALFVKIIDDDDLFTLATDVMESVKRDDIIKYFKEKK